MVNSHPLMTSRDLNEILIQAYSDMLEVPSLRLGQAFINVAPEGLLPNPWPELFNEECPLKASELIYGIVENRGKRELTGKLDMSFTRDLNV